MNNQSKEIQMPDKRIKISIVEDNEFLRSAWKSTLEGVDDFIILGDYNSCESALSSSNLGNSDVILMDISLPGMTGIEGVFKIKKSFPGMHIIMITVHQDNQHIFDAICAGAEGYLLKSVSADEMVESIKQIIDGGSPMTPVIARKVIEAFHQPKANSKIDLNEKELQVLEYLSEGKSYKMIAEAMFLSVHSVRYYLRSIYEKLQVKSRAEAVAKGMKLQFLNPLKKLYLI